MPTAARILGDHVGSTAPAFLALLAVHVLAGLTAVLTGAIAALTRKGSRRHIRAGRWYYRAISVVFSTAAILAAMRWRQDYYLLIIGAVAFTAATIGYQHRRRHRPGDTGHIAGMGTAYVAMLTAFYVDNAPHLPLWNHLPVLAFWLLPSAIGAPVIARAILRARHAGPSRPAGPWLWTGGGHLGAGDSGRSQPGTDYVGRDECLVGRVPQQDRVGFGQGEQRGHGGGAGRGGVLLPVGGHDHDLEPAVGAVRPGGPVRVEDLDLAGLLARAGHARHRPGLTAERGPGPASIVMFAAASVPLAWRGPPQHCVPCPPGASSSAAAAASQLWLPS